MPSIRAEAPQDHAAIRAIHTLAFGRDNEARLVDAIRASPAFLPTLSLVADDGEVCGHLLFSAIQICTATDRIAAVTLAPMAVHPKHQHRGIGAALVRAGLHECRRAAHRIVVVVGHPGYYPRFGFTPARAQGLEAPFPVSDRAFMALQLDPEALRGRQGTVEYSPAFALV